MFRWNINAKLQLGTTNQNIKHQSTSPLGDRGGFQTFLINFNISPPHYQVTKITKSVLIKVFIQ